MLKLVNRIIRLHRTSFAALEKFTENWLPGLVARFAFAAVLLGYFLNSASTKVGDGLGGFFTIAPGAYYQIALPAVEAAGGDVDAVVLLPWGLIVTFGTYAEFILPVLLVIGLFSRIAAIGMICFIGVQTLVDIAVHKVGPETIGSLFDRFPDSVIADQRLLWLVPLAIVALKGPGLVSVDHLIGRTWQGTGGEPVPAPLQSK